MRLRGGWLRELVELDAKLADIVAGLADDIVAVLLGGNSIQFLNTKIFFPNYVNWAFSRMILMMF